MVTAFHHAPVNAVMFSKYDVLKFDGLAGKRQNFSLLNFALYGCFFQYNILIRELNADIHISGYVCLSKLFKDSLP